MKPVPVLVVTEFAWQNRFPEDATARALAKVGNYALEWSPHASQLDPLFARCQSPVERLFLFGWCCQAELEDITVDTDYRARCRAQRSDVCILVQPKIAKIHPDFAIQTITRGVYSTVYVEIDGHEFHASTRQQVARDRQRERALLADGDVTIRFTGGEVDRDPSGCAAEAIQIARGLAKKRKAA